MTALRRLSPWASSWALVLGCATAPTPAPERPSTTAGTSEARSSPAPALPPSAAPTSAVSNPFASRPRVAHDYHPVFEDWAGVVFRPAGPLLLTAQGAAELRTQKVLFQRSPMNAIWVEGDSLWFVDGFSPMSACPEPTALVQLVGDKWLPRREANVHAMMVRPWVKGSSLAAVTPFRLGPPWGYELLVLEKNRTPPVAERAGKNREEGCHTRLSEVTALEALASGEIFVFGTECPLLRREGPTEFDGKVEEDVPEPAFVVVESWTRGAQHSTFTTLPFLELSDTFAVGPQDVWAAGSLDKDEFGVAHFDGASWTLLPERYAEPVSSILVPVGESGVDARRWFFVGNSLFELQPGRTEEHALPPKCETLSLDLHDEHLWILCAKDYETTLYTTDPTIQSFSFPEVESDALVTWNERPRLPKLDPKGPSMHRCGSESSHPAPPDFGTAGPKPGPTKPGPSVRPGSKVPQRPASDYFGF